MSGAAFILGINLLIAGLFCLTFVIIAGYSGYQSPRWFAGAYGFGMAYLAFEGSLPLLSNPKLAFILGATVFLVALLLIDIGLARRYNRAAPRMLLAGTFGLSLVAFALTADMARDSMVRLFLYQAPFAAMQVIAAYIVFGAGSRRRSDKALGIFFLLSALHFLSKPLLAGAFGGVGESSQAYLGTTYAMISQSLGVVFSVSMALLLLATLIADVLKDITAKSETDLLSGLLNRRGFEERLSEIARQNGATGLPVALVICDLDHFKAVNDTYGHATGDCLIALFATTLREVAAGHHVIGRIGGEEFAIILPQSNLAAGRLFAQTARAAFSSIFLEELGPQIHFTASFGVAEIMQGEVPAAFMARADAALYEAKRSGRDCVRANRIRQAIDSGWSLPA